MAAEQSQQQAQHASGQSVTPGSETLARNLFDIQQRAGVQTTAGWITPPPPGVMGSAMRRDPRYGRAPGVYPVFVTGTYVVDPAVGFTAPINLCYIPYGVQLVNFVIVPAGATGTLQDTMPTPLQYCTLGGAVTTPALMTAAQAVNWGTMYAQTPRALGPDGCAVVQWQKGYVLTIAGGGAPSGTLQYMIEWAPLWDSGV